MSETEVVCQAYYSLLRQIAQDQRLTKLPGYRTIACVASCILTIDLETSQKVLRTMDEAAAIVMASPDMRKAMSSLADTPDTTADASK